MRLIDADVAIEELTDRSHQAAKRVGTDSPFWEGLVIARRIVNNLPTIQPEPKEGEWVQIQRCAGDAQPDLECPFCKHRIGWFDMGRYCAGCGAKLKGGAG
jgi:hypothetical protein